MLQYGALPTNYPDPDPGIYFEEKGEERKGKGRNVKRREYEVEGGIWHTKKFWRSTPCPRTLAGFIPATLRGGERERDQGRGEERKWRRAGAYPKICFGGGKTGGQGTEVLL